MVDISVLQKEARLADLSARERKKTRKQATRRKFVIGDLVIKHSANNEHLDNLILDLVNKHVSNPNDRALFGLLPIKKREAEKASL